VIGEIPGALATEFRSLQLRGPRGMEALESSLSVALAVLAALVLHSDQPWWAGISAFMVTRSSLVLSLARGVMRIVGSVLGAALGVMATGLFAYEIPLFCLCLFALAWAGLFGFAASRFGYAWLIGAITGNLVMLMGLDQPQQVFTIAVDRVADVVIGTAASLLTGFLLPEPVVAAPSTAASPPGPLPILFWSRRNTARFEYWLRANLLLILHACRGGLTVMLLPFLANWLAPLSSTQVGVTAVAVMSIPTTAIREPDGRTVVQRSIHRVIGCVLGALLGVACLALVEDNFGIWLPLLMAGTWLASQIQSGSTGISYIGTQAGLAFLMSMVQGQGPPDSIEPGLDRLAGMTAGLALLMVISMAVSLFRLPKSPELPASGD
jgi:uncharacterized membrane protein YgaE (UPF0421/DUF939 family)